MPTKTKTSSRSRNGDGTQVSRLRQQNIGNPFQSTRGLMLMFWDIASETAASPRKTRLLLALNVGETDQRALARLCRLDRSSAQRALKEICARGLAECLTPNRPRAKIYRLTKLGAQVHRFLREQGRRPPT